MKNSRLTSLTFCCFLFSILMPYSVSAEQFAGYEMTLNGSAAIADAGETLRLSPTSGGTGSAYILTPAVVNAGTDFYLRFSFSIYGGAGGGADGMTFTIHNDPAGSFELGGGGGGLGYLGTSPSLAVEIDTWDNGANDPSANHLGINLNGSTTSVATWTAGDNLENGTTYYVWVDYDASSDLLEVFFNDSITKPGSPEMNENIDLDGLLGNQAFIGFTAATGAATNAHDVEGWELYWSTGFVMPDPVPAISDMAAILLILLLIGTSGIYLASRKPI